MVDGIVKKIFPYLDIKKCTAKSFFLKSGQKFIKTNYSEWAGHFLMQDIITAEELKEILDPDSASEIINKLNDEIKNRKGGGSARAGDSVMRVLSYVDGYSKRGERFLVDPDSQRVMGSSHESWKQVVGTETANNNFQGAGVLEYNPTVLEASRPFDNSDNPFLGNSTIFNSYNPPDWKFRREQGEVGSYDPIMKTFFDHLFPDIGCREYLFERLMMIVDGKLPVILVMNSVTGTGKGLLVESIIKHGVGMSNFSNSPESWDKSGFNAWFADKQIAWFDEAKVNPDGEKSNTNLLKRLVNNYQAIEKKGVDVQGSTRVWASLIVTNNQGTKNFKLEEDNRRFSILDVSQKKMKDVFGDAEAEVMGAAIDSDKDMLDNFWLWLSENYSTEKYGGHFALWKGKAYEKFLYDSRTLWQRTIIDMCTGGEYATITKEELTGRFNEARNPTDRSTIPHHISRIEGFLKEFVTFGGKSLGSVDREKDTATRGFEIIVNVEFVSEAVLTAHKLNMVEVNTYREPENNTAERIAEVESMLDDEEDYDL